VFSSQLVAMQVVIPLFGAPLCIMLRDCRGTWIIAMIASWACFIISILLFFQVQSFGVISYEMGNWDPPWGIEYKVDALNVYVLLIVSSIGAIVTTYSRASVSKEIESKQHYLYWTAFLLCLAGLLGVTITGDAFNIFVFLEISSLATYILIALGKNRHALYAAFRYLILGTIGATFIVIGIGLLYLMTGTLNLFDLSARLGNMDLAQPQLAALAFLIVGISLKLALFPLHLWLPNAYAFAPSAATSFLAATATKVAVYLLLRFSYDIFGKSKIFSELPLGEILIVLSVAAMFIASTVAIYQQDIKRMFAYSSVAQIGYITLGASFASQTALTASIVHLFNHAITKGGLFLLLGIIAYHLGQPTILKLRGLSKSMPWTSAGIVLCGLSLIGVPGTAGFISKWLLIQAVLEQNMWWLAFMILLSSLLAIVYVWRLFETIYFREPKNEIETNTFDVPLLMALCAAVMTASCLFFGFHTSLSLDGASEAARVLLEFAK